MGHTFALVSTQNVNATSCALGCTIMLHKKLELDVLCTHNVVEGGLLIFTLSEGYVH